MDNKQQDIKVSIDAVVFGYHSADGLSLLLIKRKIDPYKGMWALPGGLIKNEESIEEAVQRELEEETGIRVSFLEQLYTFGNVDRDPRNRVVSISYYALVKPDHLKLQASTDAEEARWFAIEKLPPLAFDHHKIFDVAIKRLRNKVLYQPIGFDLLDEKFPFSELEKLYRAIFEKDFDRRNFRKKIMKLNILEQLDEKQQMKVGRPGPIYRFDKKRYFELMASGFEIRL